jgi:hypothetical protein
LEVCRLQGCVKLQRMERTPVVKPSLLLLGQHESLVPKAKIPHNFLYDSLTLLNNYANLFSSLD